MADPRWRLPDHLLNRGRGSGRDGRACGTPPRGVSLVASLAFEELDRRARCLHRVDRGLEIRVTERKTRDKPVALGDLKLGFDGLTPDGEEADRAGVDATRLRGQEQGLEHEAGVHGAPREHVLVDEDETHDGRVEGRDVPAGNTVAPLDVGTLDAVDAVEELCDLDLGRAHLVRVALAHREITVGHGDLHGRILGLAGVGGDLLVEEAAVVLMQALGALTRGQGDAEGARVGP